MEIYVIYPLSARGPVYYFVVCLLFILCSIYQRNVFSIIFLFPRYQFKLMGHDCMVTDK